MDDNVHISTLSEATLILASVRSLNVAGLFSNFVFNELEEGNTNLANPIEANTNVANKCRVKMILFASMAAVTEVSHFFFVGVFLDPQIGTWYSNNTLVMNSTSLDLNASETLANKTLIVTTILVRNLTPDHCCCSSSFE